MAEQLAVEVDVKNVTEQQYTAAVQSSRTSPFILFGYIYTRSSGPYGPLLLAPAEGIGGPFGPPPPHKIV